MKLSIENDKGYVLIDDITGKILYVVVHDVVANKRDFISTASYQNHLDGTQSATRFCSNHQRDLEWEEQEEQFNTRMDIIGQNGNTGEHYDLLED